VSETVTRLRPGTTTNRVGATIDDWSDPDEEDIADCSVAPRDADEDNATGRQTVIAGFNIYAPPGTEILPTDRLLVRGQVHEVHGEPGVWTSPWTDVTSGVEIRTRRVTG
jgi:hypothetical protein